MKGLSSLNSVQKKAVLSNSPYTLVIAGPGTGKTHTLTQKIAYLLCKNTKPDEIIALTFTQKAAREMKQRLKLEIKAQALPFLGTFHALAMANLSQKKEIKIIPKEKREQIIKSLSKKHNIPESQINLFLSIIKNAGQKPPEDLEILKDYNQELKKGGYFDYDDLLINFMENIESFARPKILMIDEFQDTSPIQYEIVKFLGKNAIFAIGDPNQSIYGFRGAGYDSFKFLKEDFSPVSEIDLVKNYRSGEKVLKFSQFIFPETKRLKAVLETKSQVYLVKTINEFTESKFIVSEIKKEMGSLDLNSTSESEQNSRFSDFAVLARTQRTLEIIKQSLDKSSLPYQFIGHSPFIDKNAVKTVKYLENKATDSSPKKEALKFINSNALEIDTAMQELINTLSNFKTISQFLSYLKGLEEEEFYDPKSDKITLSTMHKAKGLEFKFVFLIGFEEGNIPHKKADSKKEEEEEKRLFYVAATRAKERLYLISAEFRNNKKAKISKFITMFPKAFLEEIKFFPKRKAKQLPLI